MKQVIYQFDRTAKDRVHASQKFRDIESDLQGWIDTGNISLREYFNINESKSNIVLRFTSSMTTSEKQRILNCIKPNNLFSTTTLIDNNRTDIGEEVDYSKQELQMNVNIETNSFKQAVYDLWNKAQASKATGVTP